MSKDLFVISIELLGKNLDFSVQFSPTSLTYHSFFLILFPVIRILRLRPNLYFLIHIKLLIKLTPFLSLIQFFVFFKTMVFDLIKILLSLRYLSISGGISILKNQVDVYFLIHKTCLHISSLIFSIFLFLHSFDLLLDLFA
jgi:hypothetical protein